MYSIAVQLYSLRDECANDFAGVLKWVAETGFKGVEPAGLWDMTPAEFKRVTADLGLEISSSHGPWCNPANLTEVIDTIHALGLSTACCGYGPDDFKDLDAIKRTAETVSKMQATLAEAGISLFQHNHFWEFEVLNGRLKYDIYAELCPKVLFEMDAYWSANYGQQDPVAMMRKFRDRTILIHMKDGTLDPDIPMLPLGRGRMNIPAVVAEADPAKVKWVIVELDNCVIDMRAALAKSYQYMTANGIAAGNK